MYLLLALKKLREEIAYATFILLSSLSLMNWMAHSNSQNIELFYLTIYYFTLQKIHGQKNHDYCISGWYTVTLFVMAMVFLFLIDILQND